MKITVSQKFYKPDVGKFTRELLKNMQELWRGAIRAFLEGVASRIHVDTGMSKASLRPLGAEVGVDVSISPKRGPRKGLDTFTAYYPERYKSIEEGERVGEKAFHIGWGTTSRPQLYFRFNITVFHYFLHEVNWKSLNTGEAVMRSYLDRNASRVIPELSKWMNLVTKRGQ